jgi:signal transduction histidine kinase
MFNRVTRHAARPALSALGLPVPVIVAYLAGYVALDWVSFIHPMRGLNITPWNPQAALAVALLLWRPRAWWVVWLGLAGSMVRGVYGSWPAELLSSAALTLGYSVTAAALSRWLGPMPRVLTRKHFALFMLIVGLGALLNALLYVGVLAAFSIPQPDRVLPAMFRSWIGDTVGLLVTLPLLLVLGDAERRSQSAGMARTVEWWLLAGAVLAAAYAVFARATDEQFKYFYLFFVPVIWGAARFGATGAVWAAALVQVLLIVAVQLAPYRPVTVFELQVLMTALAATGFLLGTTVDEREEAARALRASLHLAAAGDMAAALAHELNQPLTALSTYARASQLLAERLGDEHRKSAEPLIDVSSKLVGEAGRASDVVKRLRNFFRERAVELEPTDVAKLLHEVTQSQAARADALGVKLECQCGAGMPCLWLDRVQIEVVLRNLVSNALEAAAQGELTPKWVSVRAAADAQGVAIEVRDSGAGVAARQLPLLFEGQASTKPGGMGIGLSISRAIVEAHGGRLWAEAGPGGRFFVSLPADRR